MIYTNRGAMLWTGCCLLLVAGTALGASWPVAGTGEKPLLVLNVEHKPAVALEKSETQVVYQGKVSAHAGENYLAAQKEGTASVHKGFGNWSVAFRFTLNPQAPAGQYTFWAHWMQGGDPSACAQQFAIFAGPSPDQLEERGDFRLQVDDAWKFQWLNAEKVLELKADDKIVEVRNSGAADGAKVFDAFLLSPGAPPEAKAPQIKIGEVKVLEPQAARQSPLELPVQGTPEKPAVVLVLGSAPAPTPGSSDHWIACAGAVTEHEGDRAIEVHKDEVISLRSGQGQWKTNFRFPLPAGHPDGDFTFWARWKQGGDPHVSKQTFEVWAGATESALENRGDISLSPPGWDYAWKDGAKVTLKAEDMVLEVRNSGNGQTAKVFSAFLLGGPKPPPPPVELPVSGTAEKPVVVLGCGKEPLRKPGDVPNSIMLTGQATGQEGAEGVSQGADVTLVLHKGFGEWGAAFQFDLSTPIPSGYYNFHARYMSGGEPSQVRQTFSVLAGPDEKSLGVRGTFQTTNRTPFQHQWMTSTGTAAIFPGDKVIRIVNTGKAHDAKVFSAFALALETPLANWVTAEGGKRRSAFLAMGRKVEKPEKWLYVLDGEGADQVLFEGLAQESLRPWYATAKVNYLLGSEADDLAKRLNVSKRPAALVVDGDQKILGVLADPAGVEQVAQFLTEPGKAGAVPAYVDPGRSAAAPLVNGSPATWLIATGWPGHCGIGQWGLDAEALQRPNPGDPFGYEFYTAGFRIGQWQERAVGEKNLCRITQQLPESFAWGRGTSYAVSYLQVDEPAKVVLHLQHSGTESAVFLDGVNQPLSADAAPAFTLPRSKTASEGVVERGGQETHDDIVAPQEAQGPLAATLNLEKGWHCLVLKLIHRQGKGETVFFSAQLAEVNGKPLANVNVRTSDPTVALGQAQAAARLWPILTLEGVPANLPRPGEPLTVVADLRANMARRGGVFDGPFLPLEATLRVRLTDYDGKEIRTVETRGTFPGEVKLNLGQAPAAGYYALIPSLHLPDGRLIHQFHPDGFTVVLGSVEQKQRVEKKKLMESWYYAFNDWETFAPWLERIGMYKNVGSIPGLSGENIPAKWEDAKARGIVLFGDFAGDSNWMNNSEPDAKKVVALVPKYTRYFKSVNEIDGRWGDEEGVAWDAARKPEKWVERAKWQYEAVHAASPDAVYFGGSLYCSGVDRKRTDHPGILGPRAWFRKCLELGLDKYIDAWDVHAYPQYPPRLEAASVTNAPNESDQGILSVYNELGRTNTKPFLLGETSALVWHGFAGMRWQADTLTKMVAWVNSRPDWMGIALCASHLDRRVSMADYNMAHNPGEAAIYTAGALIDGLPYQRFPAQDQEIQAAYFGTTFMIWRADESKSNWTMSLEDAGPWVIVDVVGRVQPLTVRDGKVTFSIGASPVYVLTSAEYARLTRMQ